MPESIRRHKVYRDPLGSDCITIGNKNNNIYYLSISVETGLDVKVLSRSEFIKQFTRIDGTTLQQSATTLLGYARLLGATSEALVELTQWVEVHEKDAYAMQSLRTAKAVAKKKAAKKTSRTPVKRK